MLTTLPLTRDPVKLARTPVVDFGSAKKEKTEKPLHLQGANEPPQFESFAESEARKRREAAEKAGATPTPVREAPAPPASPAPVKSAKSFGLWTPDEPPLPPPPSPATSAKSAKSSKSFGLWTPGAPLPPASTQEESPAARTPRASAGGSSRKPANRLESELNELVRECLRQHRGQLETSWKARGTKKDAFPDKERNLRWSLVDRYVQKHGKGVDVKKDSVVKYVKDKITPLFQAR